MTLRPGERVYRSGHRRRGLAPLELVLWLPILLMASALLVDLGVMAVWRIRGEIVARDAVWRRVWPRTGRGEPRPDPKVWPESARISVGGSPPIAQLDDPDLDRPVVRGPLPNGFHVRRTLDPLQGVSEGEAAIQRRFPLLPKLGEYRSGEIRHPLLDGKWQTAAMPDVRRLRGWSNFSRRTLVLYELPQTDQQLPQAYIDAFLAILDLPHFEGLRVLDRDEDWRAYANWPDRAGYGDFHPRVNRNMCELDPATVADRQVAPLLNSTDARGNVRLGRISRLPRTMTDSFLKVFRRAVARMEAEISRMEAALSAVPPPSLSERQRMQAQIAALRAEISSRLEPQIEQLEAYRGKLAPLEDKFLRH